MNTKSQSMCNLNVYSPSDIEMNSLIENKLFEMDTLLVLVLLE